MLARMLGLADGTKQNVRASWAICDRIVALVHTPLEKARLASPRIRASHSIGVPQKLFTLLFSYFSSTKEGKAAAAPWERGTVTPVKVRLRTAASFQSFQSYHISVSRLSKLRHTVSNSPWETCENCKSHRMSKLSNCQAKRDTLKRADLMPEQRCRVRNKRWMHSIALANIG